MYHKIICKQCGRESVKMDNEAKYCDRKCSSLAQTAPPLMKICQQCKKLFNARLHEQGRGISRANLKVFCSRRCAAQFRAITVNQSNHHGWRGGIVFDSGYLRVNQYLGKGFRKLKGQHRIIIEQIFRRELTHDEVVHHVDGNKSNNNPANLQVLTRSEHSKLHAKRRYERMETI